MSDIKTKSAQIAEQFKPTLNIDAESVEDRISEMMAHDVSEETAVRSVRNNIRNEAENAPTPEPDSDSFDPIPIESIDGTEEEPVDLIAEFHSEWDNDSENVSQVGLFVGETGSLKGTAWADQTKEGFEFEEGKTYRIHNVDTSEYQGRFAFGFTNNTIVEEHTETTGEYSFETEENEVTVEGLLVTVKNGSGLIKRCSEDDCNRVLKNGECQEHGDVEGEFDLQIKAILDNGYHPHNVVFLTESTEEIAQMTVEEAKELFKEELDRDIVDSKVEEKALGNYFRVTGTVMGENIIPNSFEIVNTRTEDQVEEFNSRLE